MVKRFVCISTWHGNLRGAGICQAGECPLLLSLNEALHMYEQCTSQVMYMASVFHIHLTCNVCTYSNPYSTLQTVQARTQAKYKSKIFVTIFTHLYISNILLYYK